jgi:hypothetical protein
VPDGADAYGDVSFDALSFDALSFDVLSFDVLSSDATFLDATSFDAVEIGPRPVTLPCGGLRSSVLSDTDESSVRSACVRADTPALRKAA